MSTETIPMSKTHHGHSIKRVRDMLGIKQETLAAELNMTQQAFSKLEQKEQIEDEMLDKIAKYCHVSTEALKTMSEEATINYLTRLLIAKTNTSFPKIVNTRLIQ